MREHTHHPTIPYARRSPRAQPRRYRRRPSVQLISEGVVATYIHDISERHRSGARTPEARRRWRPSEQGA